jgi:hypothetical protein
MGKGGSSFGKGGSGVDDCGHILKDLPSIQTMKKSIFSLAIAGFIVLTGFICRAQSPLPGLEKYHRVIFVGDSITYYGTYIDDIEAYVLTRDTNSTITFLNLGQSSETVSGLSEPGHAGGKYVRPDAHTRIEAVLEKTKPDLVIADYGMNDGIYQPLSDEHFQKFKDGMNWLHDTVRRANHPRHAVTVRPRRLHQTALAGRREGFFRTLHELQRRA